LNCEETNHLIGTIGDHSFRIFNGLLCFVESLDEKLAEAELCGFFDPVLTSRHSRTPTH